jgi:hypothetical protein
MPIAAVFDFPGEDIAKYHKVNEIGGPLINDQPQRTSHVCYRTENGFTVIDVWQDDESFAAFGPVIGPAITQAGLSGGPPRIYPVEGTM